VGFDINCGVRLIRTNLTEKDVEPLKETLAQTLFDHIPVGVGSQGVIPTTMKDLNDALVKRKKEREKKKERRKKQKEMKERKRKEEERNRKRCDLIPMKHIDKNNKIINKQEMGMDWSLREGYCWPEDKEHAEEFGRMLSADPTKGKKKIKRNELKNKELKNKEMN